MVKASRSFAIQTLRFDSDFRIWLLVRFRRSLHGEDKRSWAYDAKLGGFITGRKRNKVPTSNLSSISLTSCRDMTGFRQAGVEWRCARMRGRHGSTLDSLLTQRWVVSLLENSVQYLHRVTTQIFCCFRTLPFSYFTYASSVVMVCRLVGSSNGNRS